MKIRVFIGISAVLLVIGIVLFLKTPVPKKEVTSFWDTQRKGSNFFNRVEQKDRLIAAKQLGLSWVRLTPSKWKSTFGNGETPLGSIKINISPFHPA